MFDAAMPVLAVTEIASGSFAYFFRSAEIIALSNSDLPVPSPIFSIYPTLTPWIPTHRRIQ